MFLMFVMAFFAGLFFSSAHVIREPYCDFGVPLWPAMGLLVGLSFFEVSLSFGLVEAWGVLVPVPANYNAFLWPSFRSLLIPPQKDDSWCLQQI